MNVNRIIMSSIIIFSTILFLSLVATPLLVVAQSASSMEAEARFVVYPDGTVGLSAKGNNTNGYNMYYTGPTVHVHGQVSKSDDVHTSVINVTLAVPAQEASQFPYNATSATITDNYSNGIEVSAINASVVLPNSAQTQGMQYDFSGFPFDSADFSLTGEYTNQSFDGTMTAHLVPGFTLGDVHLNFQGNLTEITVNDSVQVFYNYTLPFPGFPTIDQTYLNQLLQNLSTTIPGKGSGSLYNLTSGDLECTTFNTIVTPLDANSASVSFDVVIQGDIMRFLADLYSTEAGTPSYDSSGLSLPTLNSSMIYSLLNATSYAPKSGQLTISYSKSSRRLDLQATASINLKEAWNATAEAALSAYPLSMQPYLQSMYNTTFSSVLSYKEEMWYSNGQMSYNGEYTIGGDLNAEATYLKDVYLDLMNSTGATPEGIMPMLKETGVDVSDMDFSLDVGASSSAWSFENLRVTPPTDPINATCFRLRRFFNLTSSENEPPLENEKLKLIVQGGINATHSVTVFIDPNDPDRPSDPDQFAAGNTMVWNNMRISRLRSLLFKVWEGQAEAIYNSTSISDANPEMINSTETAGCTLTLNSISMPATIRIQNATSVPDVGPNPSTYKMLGSYVQITADQKDVVVNATLRMYYTLKQLTDNGINENDLKIYYWNTTAGSWTAADTQINTAEHYAWTVVDHFSTWVLLGQSAQTPWTQPWFIPTIAIVVTAIAIITVIGLKRRQRPQKTKAPETPIQLAPLPPTTN